MGSRERKRAEKRKRRERAARAPEKREGLGVDPVESGGNGAQADDRPGEAPIAGSAAATGSSSIERAYARAEERNEAVRESLEPLAEGERPRVVTVGAIVAGVIAAIFIVSGLVALIGGVEVDGEQPNPFPLFLFGSMMVAMAVGMWRARYWAVLGFQALLVIFLLAASAGLVRAANPIQAIGTTLLVGGLGTLFYFMVKALARIQMPTRD